VDAIVDTIKTAIINGERVEIRGFGSFSPRSYKPYRGRNPKTGEIIEAVASVTIGKCAGVGRFRQATK
jgi:nucleoid DNA-binding protein